MGIAGLMLASDPAFAWENTCSGAHCAREKKGGATGLMLASGPEVSYPYLPPVTRVHIALQPLRLRRLLPVREPYCRGVFGGQRP